MLKKITLLLLLSNFCYGQELIYTVDLHSTATHKVGVRVELKKMGATTVTYQMPIWAPGAYSVTHYGHYISDFKAFDKNGKELSVQQANGDRWEISNAKDIANISYSVSDSHKDSTSLYFAMAHIDTNFFFANGTCLFGYVNDKKNIPSTVDYDFPYEWKLATALDPLPSGKHDGTAPPDFKYSGFEAKNYDELADAPIMAGVDSIFQTHSFKDGTATYDIVLATDRKFEMDSLEYYIHKIVHAETEFFHDTPFKHYTFLINAPTYFKSPSMSFGALEHANSSDYLLVNLPWKMFKSQELATFSHEFFHLWNVKRIHSALLGPFDYTKRVMTTSLWLSEGITDYYSRTILTRWNILPYHSFEESVSQLSKAANRSKAAKSETLEQLSIDESDFDLGKATVFYFKGTLVGLLLDIEIRSRTDNKKSLDDVMFALNAEAKKGKTFKDSELIGKMEKITGLDLQDFYKKYIAGTDSLPIDEYLKKMGVGNIETGTQTESRIALGGKLNFESENSTAYVERVDSSTPFASAGIMEGDTLKTLNGKPFTIQEIVDLQNGQPPVTLEIEVIRKGQQKHFSVFVEKRNKTTKPKTAYGPLPDATPLEVAIRHGIVGKDY